METQRKKNLSQLSGHTGDEKLPYQIGRVKPLGQKHFHNLVTKISGGYSSLPDEVRFRVSTLALEMQETYINHSRTTKQVPNGNGMLEVPTKELMKKQMKKRAMSRAESCKISRSNHFDPRMQTMGFTQTVETRGGDIVLANKKGKPFKCRFCNMMGCKTNICKVRAELSQKFMSTHSLRKIT